MTTAYLTGLVTPLLPLGAIVATSLLRKASPPRRANARNVTSPEVDRLPGAPASVAKANAVGLVTSSSPVGVDMANAATGAMRSRANCDHDRALPLPLLPITAGPRADVVTAQALPLGGAVIATEGVRKVIAMGALARVTGRATSSCLA
jgi:hypothetical protein